MYAKTDLKAGPHGITAFIIEKGMEGYIQTPENWEPWVLMLLHLHVCWGFFFSYVEFQIVKFSIDSRYLDKKICKQILRHVLSFLWELQIHHSSEAWQAWHAGEWYVSLLPPIYIHNFPLFYTTGSTLVEEYMGSFFLLEKSRKNEKAQILF